MVITCDFIRRLEGHPVLCGLSIFYFYFYCEHLAPPRVNQRVLSLSLFIYTYVYDLPVTVSADCKAIRFFAVFGPFLGSFCISSFYSEQLARPRVKPKRALSIYTSV